MLNKMTISLNQQLFATKGTRQGTLINCEIQAMPFFIKSHANNYWT